MVLVQVDLQGWVWYQHWDKDGRKRAVRGNEERKKRTCQHTKEIIDCSEEDAGLLILACCRGDW